MFFITDLLHSIWATLVHLFVVIGMAGFVASYFIKNIPFLRNKINNFVGIEIFTFILTLSYLNNQSFLFDTNTIVAWSILTGLVLFQVILVMATRVALYNWNTNQRVLEIYDMSDEEFDRKFKEFCEK
jgi:hypothetical protein